MSLSFIVYRHISLSTLSILQVEPRATPEVQPMLLPLRPPAGRRLSRQLEEQYVMETNYPNTALAV